MLCVADLFLFGDGGLLLLQHGEKFCDLQLKTLLWGRPVSGDLCLNPCYLGLERVEQEKESKPGKKRCLGKTTTGSMLEDICLCLWPTTCNWNCQQRTNKKQCFPWIQEALQYAPSSEIKHYFMVSGTSMHYGKQANGKHCDTVGNVVLLNLGSCYICGSCFDTSYIRKHCCRPRTSFHGNGVPWWLWPLVAG